MTTTLLNQRRQGTLEDQLELESEAVHLGVQRYRKLVTESEQNNQITRTTSGQRLLYHAVGRLSEALEQDYNEQSSRRGATSVTVNMVSELGFDVAAYITCRSVLDSIAAMKTYTNAAMTLGGSVEAELRISSYRKQNPGHYHTVSKRIRKSSCVEYRRGVFQGAIKTLQNDNQIELDAWGQELKVKVGVYLLEMFSLFTGFVTFQNINYRENRLKKMIVPTDEVMSWIDEENSRCELLTPIYCPCVIKPKPWTNPFDGGYHSEELSQKNRLVKVKAVNYLRDLENIEMPLVYQAVNAAQDTPWQINQKVLDVFKTLWMSGSELAGLPRRNDKEVPQHPLPDRHLKKEDMTLEQLTLHREWKREATAVHIDNIAVRSQRIRVAKSLHLAEKFANFEAIYFPHNLDFRGRMYPIPMFLNPQGADLERSLLMFSEGKVVDSHEAVEWLMIHGANCWGLDKMSFKDRLDWIENNSDMVYSCAQNPYDDLRWAEADKPFQFLAFCFEWEEFLRGVCGEWKSYLPIALDGTCNGLQHFSAMLRDYAGGYSVNLVPTDEPQDIYNVVAEKVSQLYPPDSPWHQFGITRKLVKTPVMTIPYGSTKNGRVAMVLKHVREKLETSKNDPFNGHYFEHAVDMASKIEQAISDVIVSAPKVLKYITDLSRVVSRENLPIVWTTPADFPVMQTYFKTKEHAVRVFNAKVRSNSRRDILIHKIDQMRVDAKKQSQGLAPNFIHSLDAACLMIYIDKAVKAGIHSFAMIHDCYGTHAADSQKASQLIREAFHEVYTKFNPLEELTADVACERLRDELPSLPAIGDLDINGVLSSQYFFS